MFNLTGKRALVTGGAGGIGSAIVDLFVRSGCKVMITGRNEDSLRDIASKYGEANVFYTILDLANDFSPDELISDAEVKLGGNLDIMVCNAGITCDKLAMRMGDQDWQKVIDINLSANFRLNRAAVKKMLRNRSGKIINISSIIGVIGNVGQANYAASKAGLIGMSKSIAREVADRGVCVNVIAPGFIETPMTAALKEENKDRLKESIPMKRLGVPEDVAKSALFLASDMSDYITGQTIHVNGGMAMI